MSELVYEQLTLFQEDSHVSHSQSQGIDKGRQMTVTSGLKCLESYKSFSPLGCLVRTCLGSSIWHSTRCCLTWKRKDTKYKHSLFRLAVSVPGTSENESALWPTPTTGAALCAGTGSFKQLMKLKEKGLITEKERRNLSQGNGGRTNPEWIEWLQGFERTWTGLIPTPTYSNYKGAPSARFVGGGTLQAQPSRTDRDFPGRDYWETEPDVDRVVDRVPNRMDRIKCLGNAVVPQQFYPFFAAVAMIEEIHRSAET